MATDQPYYLRALTGNGPSGEEVINKFGQNSAVGTTLVPVAQGGIYRTPQVGAATKLRVAAGNAADTAAGAGARSIHIQGIDANGAFIEEILPTAGVSAGANSIYDYIRLFRAFVHDTGSYATTGTGSHVADVVIENAAGTQDWATIALNGYADGQSEIGWFTIPMGKTGYLLSFDYSVDAVKITTIQVYTRQGILTTAAPYRAMRKLFGIEAAVTDGQKIFPAPLGPFPEGSDIGFLASVDVATASVEIQFALLLRDNE